MIQRDSVFGIGLYEKKKELEEKLQELVNYFLKFPYLGIILVNNYFKGKINANIKDAKIVRKNKILTM